MMSTNPFEEFLKNYSELQKQFFNSWMETLPTPQNFAKFSLSESWEKTLEYQEELVKKSLDAQSQVAKMAIDTQKQMWENYFKMARQAQLNQSGKL